MRRIGRDELEERLALAIKAAPRHVLMKLRSKLAVESDNAAGDLAAFLAGRLDGASSMVVEADLVPDNHHGHRPGKWGIDEPPPA